MDFGDFWSQILKIPESLVVVDAGSHNSGEAEGFWFARFDPTRSQFTPPQPARNSNLNPRINTRM